MKIVLLGTAWPYRGGLASFNERLIQEFKKEGNDAEIITFNLQYPGILFPGKTQYSSSPQPVDLKITRKVNSVNPLNWISVGNQIKKMNPDILIIKYWMPFMAPCFGTIAGRVKKNNHTKVICIADNIVPHERKFYDAAFTKYFIRQMDAFVVMSESVLKDLAQFNRNKLRASNPHPLFDNFGNAVSKEQACEKLNLDPAKKYFLFFGFVRDYKGLDLLIEAFADPRLKNYDLIVAGEYYTDEKKYLKQIEDLHLQNRIHQFKHFIADEDVKYYFCAADLVVQPYKHATQSGVTQIAFHFEIPMLVTHVGGLGEMVPDGKAGYVVEPDVQSIANALADFASADKRNFFIQNIKEEKKRFGWDRMVNTIIQLYQKLHF